MEIDFLDVPLEVKFSEDAEMTFEGYGAVFEVKDHGGDVIEATAFDGAMKKAANGWRPKMLWQHDPSEPIGKWLTMEVDGKGLRLKGKLMKEISKAQEVYAMMKAGVVDGLSIGYRTLESEYDKQVRRIKSLDLWEVSVVTFPMNARSLVSSVKQLTVRETERVLRDAGVPVTFAKLIANHGYDEAKRRLDEDQREADQLALLLKEISGLKEAFNAQR